MKQPPDDARSDIGLGVHNLVAFGKRATRFTCGPRVFVAFAREVGVSRRFTRQ